MAQSKKTQSNIDWKSRLGVVFSTRPDFSYDHIGEPEPDTLPPQHQNLLVSLDRKQRKGKSVTLIRGFTGTAEELDKLATMLKKHCGSGGAVKDGEILIQGNFREKIVVFLAGQGYKVKKAGG